jgi:DNA invertase Pin-like site-specific DNA recombinase
VQASFLADAPRTVAYCRVSTEEQSANGQSLAVQEQQLRGWGQMTERHIDQVVIEAGVSGGIPFAQRPEGGKLWASLRRGDNLVVAKLDRFSRNLFDCLQVSQELQKRGVNLFLLDVGASDPVTGNGQSKLFLSMLGAFAEFERDRISERIKATKQRQKAWRVQRRCGTVRLRLRRRQASGAGARAAGGHQAGEAAGGEGSQPAQDQRRATRAGPIPVPCDRAEGAERTGCLTATVQRAMQRAV